MQIKANQDTGRKIMMHRIWMYIHFIILFSFVFPNGNQFAFTGSNETHSTISLQSSTEIRKVVMDIQELQKKEKGTPQI